VNNVNYRFGGGNIAVSATDLGGGSIARPYPHPHPKKQKFISLYN
jgi:hypothetical protein